MLVSDLPTHDAVHKADVINPLETLRREKTASRRREKEEGGAVTAGGRIKFLPRTNSTRPAINNRADAYCKTVNFFR